MGKNKFLDAILKEYASFIPIEIEILKGGSNNCESLIKLANDLSIQLKKSNTDCDSLINLANNMSNKLKSPNCDPLIKLANDLSNQLKNLKDEEVKNPPEISEETSAESPASDCASRNGTGKLILGIEGKKNSVSLCIESTNAGYSNPNNISNLTDDDIEIFMKPSSTKK